MFKEPRTISKARMMLPVRYQFLLTVCLMVDSSCGNATVPSVVNHTHEHSGRTLDVRFQSSKEEAMFFVKMIFSKFGNESEISRQSLNALVQEIGLGRYVKSSESDGHHEHLDGHHDDGHGYDHQGLDQDHDEHLNQNGHLPRKEEHNDSDDFNGNSNEQDNNFGGESDNEKHGKEQENNNKVRHRRSLDDSGKVKHVPHLHTSHVDCLNAEQILNLYHMEYQTQLNTEQFLHLCPAVIFQLDNSRCRETRKHLGRHGSHGSESDANVDEGVTAEVWGYSTLAVIIISLVGLLGVAVIPIMQKVFYNHLLQFLVALAVGALTGDALLHLLPHAIIGEHEHWDSDSNHHGDADGVDLVEGHQSVVMKGLCVLGGLFFFYLIERVVVIISAYKITQSKRSLKKKVEDSTGKKLSSYDDYVYSGKIQGSSEDDAKTSSCKSGSHSDSENEHDKKSSAAHGHSHGTDLTDSISSVAWMVILGDGIHNFSDGLAIGAAFANSITGGISTAVAVFCHELPHEIGDFAVLLRTGMSVKQAIVYNIMSSFLCFLGMIIGVVIGNHDGVSQWVFCAIAGTFIYIALVDMLPVMTSEDSEGMKGLKHLLLQVLGLITGSGIMLVIALYEEQIKSFLKT